MRFEQWSPAQQTGIYPIKLTGQLHAFFSLYVILLDWNFNLKIKSFLFQCVTTYLICFAYLD